MKGIRTIPRSGKLERVKLKYGLNEEGSGRENEELGKSGTRNLEGESRI